MPKAPKQKEAPEEKPKEPLKTALGPQIRPGFRCRDCVPAGKVGIEAALSALRTDVRFAAEVRFVLTSVGWRSPDIDSREFPKRVQTLVNMGFVHVCGELLERRHDAVGSNDSPRRPAPTFDTPSSTSGGGSSSAPESTFDPDHSASQQAGSLQDAAESGVPMVEVCSLNRGGA